MKKISQKLLALSLCIAMIVTLIPSTIFASISNYTENKTSNYTVSKHTESTLAPGITQYINYAYDANGNQRKYQVATADLTNEDVIVQTSYKDQYTTGSFGMAKLSNQMAYANSLYTDPTSDRFISENYTAVAGINASFYNMSTGQPSGRTVLDGISIGEGSYGGFFALLDDGTAVIMKDKGTSNWDSVKDRVVQAIGGESVFLLDGEKQTPYTSYFSQAYPHSMIGVTADNKVVIVQTDGSATEGFSGDALADVMIEAGCVAALSLDGGGSATYCAKPEGEDDIQVLGGCSDGSERTISAGFIFASKATPSNAFDHVNITVDDAYITTGVSTAFTATGVSSSGNSADIPENITYEATNGTVKDGVFTATALGDAVITAKVDGVAVGSTTVHVCAPEKIAFATSKYSVKYGESSELEVIATINDGKNEIKMDASSLNISLDNTAIGTLDGLTFTAVSLENVPTNQTGTITVTCKDNTSLTSSASISIMGQVTEVVESFDNASSNWHAEEINGEGQNAWYGKNYSLTDATAEDGQTHGTDGSMRVSLNNLNAMINYNANSKDYFQLLVMPEESIEIQNCESYGVWVYIPDDMYSLYIDLWYYTDNNSDGVYETVVKKSKVLPAYEILKKADDSHWYYLKVDVGGKNILLPGSDLSNYIGKTAVLKDKRCIQIVLMPFNGNGDLQTIGSINGKYTMYLDDFTVDYAKDVADRTAPVYGTVNMLKNDGSSVALTRNVAADSTDSTLNVVADVSDAGDGIDATTAKAYVDGVETSCTYSNGKIAISDVAVANGVHRVTFKISDRAGNEATVVRLINVNSSVTASTVVVEPKDATLDRIYFGSVYWLNVKATDAETIQSVTTTIDLNSAHHWELDHMEVAEGFTATYTEDEENNSATITITRTGENDATGELVLASLPVRIIYYDTDIQYPGLTAAEYWQSAKYSVWFWPHDLKVDVDMGKITYVDGYIANTVGTFSNEMFSVDTECYLSQQQMATADPTYYAEHETCHVHTEEAVDDKAPTCTEAGYTGRTYCAVCDSIVDWGTEVPATGHTYALVGDQFVCSDCEEVYAAGTGIFEMNDKTYYALNNKVVSGWRQVEDDWYYFMPDTYEAAEGEVTTPDGVTFNFEDGKANSGVWVTDSKGSKYWYGPTYYKNVSINVDYLEETIDGNTYFFDRKGYVIKDTVIYTHISNEYTKIWYSCDINGIATKLIGPMLQEYEDVTYYVDENGETKYGDSKIVKLGDVYYYIDWNGNPRSGNRTITEAEANGLLPVGPYSFDTNGKLTTVLDGIDPVDKYYRVGGAIQKNAGLIRVGNDYYYVISTGKIYSGDVVLSDTNSNGLMPAGLYTFDTDGKMVIESKIIDANGYYRVNGGIQKNAGLVKIDDDYYFVISTGKIYSGNVLMDETEANGLLPAGLYTFGADGKMTTFLNGIDANGYYKVNGVIQKNAGLIKIDDDYYFVIRNGKIYSGYVLMDETEANGLLPTGLYYFGTDGKLVQ